MPAANFPNVRSTFTNPPTTVMRSAALWSAETPAKIFCVGDASRWLEVQSASAGFSRPATWPGIFHGLLTALSSGRSMLSAVATRPWFNRVLVGLKRLTGTRVAGTRTAGTRSAAAQLRSSKTAGRCILDCGALRFILALILTNISASGRRPLVLPPIRAQRSGLPQCLLS